MKTVAIERLVFSAGLAAADRVVSTPVADGSDSVLPELVRVFQQDSVAVEEPLEIRLAGETLAVTMRTPGSDRELVVGYLLAEGIISTAAQLGSVAHCGRPGAGRNTIEVVSAAGTQFDWEPEVMGRANVVSAACGVCGRRSVDDLLARIEPLQDNSRFSARWVAALTSELLERQENFQTTGGVHAAAFWPSARATEPLVVREDVGRHNAVDKVVGHLALAGLLPAGGAALVVSGRVGFEIAQKALVARVPLLVSVSAPTSLSIEIARRAGLTLVSFARAGRFNVYCGQERIVYSPDTALACTSR